jgi:hypothetical protein
MASIHGNVLIVDTDGFVVKVFLFQANGIVIFSNDQKSFLLVNFKIIPLLNHPNGHF